MGRERGGNAAATPRARPAARRRARAAVGVRRAPHRGDRRSAPVPRDTTRRHVDLRSRKHNNRTLCCCDFAKLILLSPHSGKAKATPALILPAVDCAGRREERPGRPLSLVLCLKMLVQSRDAQCPSVSLNQRHVVRRRFRREPESRPSPRVRRCERVNSRCGLVDPESKDFQPF